MKRVRIFCIYQKALFNFKKQFFHDRKIQNGGNMTDPVISFEKTNLKVFVHEKICSIQLTGHECWWIFILLNSLSIDLSKKKIFNFLKVLEVSPPLIHSVAHFSLLQIQRMQTATTTDTDMIANTLEIPYNEIPCNKASLLQARHGSP